jgi:hypothetical protein
MHRHHLHEAVGAAVAPRPPLLRVVVLVLLVLAREAVHDLYGRCTCVYI